MTQVIITYCGFDGSGRNVTEAKKNASHRIESMAAGFRSPKIIAWRGYAKMLYASPHGIASAIVVDNGEIRTSLCYGTESCGWSRHDWDEAERAVKRDLAQLGWKHEDGQACPDILNGDIEGQRAFAYWVGYQLAYRAAPPDVTEYARHEWACNHTREFMAA